MKPDAAFDAARPVARHCAELFRADAGKDADGDGFAQFGADLARALVPGLGGLLGAAKLRISCAAPATRAAGEILSDAGTLCSAATIAFPDAGAQIGAILDGETLIALTDRLFGGDGAASDGELPDELPLMADLVATQMHTLIGDAMERVLPALGRPQIAGRATSPVGLDLLGRDGEGVTLDLTVAQPGSIDWSFRLVVRVPAQARFAVRRAKPAMKGHTRRLDPQGGALGDMPFDLVAVVAETNMPLSKVSALKPGDIVPLPIARQVPLRVGERTLAHGSVGSLDDRVALRISALS